MSRFLVALLLLLWTIPALAEDSPPRGEDRTGDRSCVCHNRNSHDRGEQSR